MLFRVASSFDMMRKLGFERTVSCGQRQTDTKVILGLMAAMELLRDPLGWGIQPKDIFYLRGLDPFIRGVFDSIRPMVSRY